MSENGVREYIGARYVPVMANPIEWSDTRGYEPLTIVTHGGNSYTSMQTVPPGIDISNTNFWALTGNYNAQIEQYRQETEEVRGQLSDLETKIGENENEILAVSGDLTELKENFAKWNSINALNPPAGYDALIPNDKTANNSHILERLANYCFSQRKALYIPAGVYHFQDPVTMVGSAVMFLFGESKYSTLFFYHGNEKFLTFQPISTAQNMVYGGVTNVGFEGPLGNSEAIYAVSPENWIFENLSFNNFNKGIHIFEPYKNGNNYITQCNYFSATTNGVGYEIEGLSVSNYFTNTYASFVIGGSSSNSYGFFLHNDSVVSDNSFLNCETANGRVGFKVKSSTYNLLSSDLSFSGCVVDGAYYGFEMDNLAFAKIENCHVNVSNENGATGIYLRQVHNNACNNNVFMYMGSAQSNVYGVNLINSGTTCVGNSFINLFTALNSENSNFSDAVYNISSNVLQNSISPANGIRLYGSGYSGVVSNNACNFVQKDYDIISNVPNTIVAGNTTVNVSNSGAGSITVNNISRT